MPTKTYIIIGSSAAGLSAASTLARHDLSARIICISDEKEQPYNKCFLVDYVGAERSHEQLFTLRAPLLENPQFALLLGVAVTSIDPDAMTITLGDGRVLRYDALFMGMGGSAFRPTLPGSTYAGVFTFYTLADTHNLMHWMAQRSARHAVVVGAGLTGLECANALSARGLAVTLIERGNRVLPHHADQTGSEHIAHAAGAAGVTVKTFAHVQEITGNNGQVTGVILADGTHVPADLVVFAVGMRVNSALAANAGVACSGQHVIVNNQLQTSVSSIFAGGDLVVAPCAVTGQLVPSATWPDAVLQGSSAAYNMMGQTRVYPGVIGHTVSQFFGLEFAACGALQGPSKRTVLVVDKPGAYRVLELVDGVLQAYSLIGATSTAAMACRRALLTKQPISEPESLLSL